MQIFDLEDPSHADDPTPMDTEPGGGGDSSDSTCPGVFADGRCFERFADAASWEDSFVRCDQDRLRLAKLETPAIRAAVGKLLALSDEVYVGGIDANKSGEYIWIDGTKVTMDEGWLPTQPDYEVEEYCITMQNAGAIGLRDATCNEPLDFICEHVTD